MPQLEVKARRVGGATYQVPMEVRPERQSDPGPALDDRPTPVPAREKTMTERLAGEILDAVNGTRRRCQEAGRHPQDGRGQQGFRTLQLVISALTFTIDRSRCETKEETMPRQVSLEITRNIGIMAHIDAGKTTTTERILLLYRYKPQNRRDPRGRCDDGLDGAGAGERHHHYLRRYHLLLEGSPESTSSTPPATLTSPSRWSVPCACSTVP